MRIIFALLTLCLFASCQNPAGNPSFAGPSYPMELHNPNSLPIQVIREQENIDIINSTASTFEFPVLWINQRYSVQLPSIYAGQTLRVNLWLLRDVFGEQMNAGGIWRTGEPTPVVIAELQVSEDEPLVGLIVIGED
ncbi:MAG: hypothetical protein VX615_03475 [Planctomycetota bacterium]|nr:hypothetical protein [Planctomycetota bacterium]